MSARPQSTRRKLSRSGSRCRTASVYGSASTASTRRRITRSSEVMPRVMGSTCRRKNCEPRRWNGRSPAARARAAWLGNSFRISPAASASRCPDRALPAMRHDLLGEQRHRLPYQGMVHDPALVEIANELVHPVFALEGAHPFDAEIGIAEDAHFALDILVADPLDAGEHLAERLEAADVGFADRPQPLAGFAQKAQ